MTAVFGIRPLTDLQVERAFEVHGDSLRGYITNRLPVEDWHLAEDLAQEIWVEVLEGMPAGPGAGNGVGQPEDEGLPAWLARWARTMVRRHVSPTAVVADWELLTQTLGHSTTWPGTWLEVLPARGRRCYSSLPPSTSLTWPERSYQ